MFGMFFRSARQPFVRAALTLVVLALALAPPAHLAGAPGAGAPNAAAAPSSASQRPGFARTATMRVGTNEVAFEAGAIDPEGGFAYFVVEATQPLASTHIFKVRLSDFTRVLTATLSVRAGAGIMTMSADPANGYLYLGILYDGTPGPTPPGDLLRLRMSDLNEVSRFRLSAGEYAPVGSAVDAAGGYAYFTVRSDPPGRVIRVRLSDFTRTDMLPLPGDEKVYTISLDPGQGYGYVGVADAPSRVVRIRLSDFTRAETLTLDPNVQFAETAAIDAAGGYLYLGTTARLVQIRLSDFSQTAGITFSPGDSIGGPIVVDPVTGYAYLGGSAGGTAEVIQIHLPDLVRGGTLRFPPGRDGVWVGLIDPLAGFAYFAANPYAALPSDLAKVNVRLPAAAWLPLLGAPPSTGRN